MPVYAPSAPSTPEDRGRGESAGVTALHPGFLFGLLLFACLAAAALWIDVVRTGYGVKGDESTYVTMALSVAHDGDLAFDRRDLLRFWQVYQGGPEGIFLKRGREVDVALDGHWPFVHVATTPVEEVDRLYFGKAFVYPLIAAPFARLAGLNGILALNILLLAGVFGCAYAYASTRGSSGGALLIAGAFLAGSIAPLYLVWLTPEVFHFALVFFAYFVWLYKESRPSPGASMRFLWRPSSDLVAAVLLGLATFSKPSHALLIGPIVLLCWWRRRWAHGGRVAALFVVVTIGCFALTSIGSGDVNYQGGDRKTFYGHFPFEAGEAQFERLGTAMTTNEIPSDDSAPSLWGLLARNSVYFLAGRHFGLLPYYFPGVVLIVWALWRRRDLELWHALIGGTVAATALVLLVFLPNTWSGGGGPPGNRYFLSVYPVLFFLLPATPSLVPGIVAWVGGALFTGQILADPFVAAKRPWQNTQQGLVRILPVELTMVNDLPVRPDARRVPYGENPRVSLYYLDNHASRPEGAGVWVLGGKRADIIVRSPRQIEAFEMVVRSPIANVASITVSGTTERIVLEPDAPVRVRVPARPVTAQNGHNVLVSIAAEEGVVPQLTRVGSADRRFLGVHVRFDAVAATNE
ncbi:MAG: hypothetical protein QF634_14670 [Vicinamibacterales bacterium]|nr:hypothetical protein [Vicinamibacterales bacterium]